MRGLGVRVGRLRDGWMDGRDSCCLDNRWRGRDTVSFKEEHISDYLKETRLSTHHQTRHQSNRHRSNELWR